MINFIVVDDVKYFGNEVDKIINSVMMKNILEYKIFNFEDYDKDFMQLANSQMANKVYILDIETKTASGIDIARMIRKNDVNSIIIFITVHEELGSTIVKDQLMILTFICKFDDFGQNLRRAIVKSLKFFSRNKVVKFSDYGTLYTINLSDILYVTRDSIERKCLIKTVYATYKVNKTLSEIKKMCDGELIQTHRACLINREKIAKVNLKKNEISLDNGEIIDMVSDRYKGEIIGV